jgi:hypothetical protein
MSNADPIRYAWERCNPGVPFPAALARTAMDLSVPIFYASAPRVVVGREAVEAALLSFIHKPSPESRS